jgi:iron only hydrogenase large subunit-like protein
MEMQRHIDKEKIQEERARFNNYQREYERKIREADNERLRSYYNEFCKNETDSKITQGAYKFLLFMLKKE